MILADYRGEKLVTPRVMGVPGPKTFYQGRTALARGDKESAQRYLPRRSQLTAGGARRSRRFKSPR
jgi:hypothetical protein